jgi:protease II
MIDISLTDEQAKWLKDHLDMQIVRAHYMEEGSLRDDNLEHAQTIHDKIMKEVKSRSW